MNTITNNKGKRDQTWDIVKGIGIILVVIGHSGCPAYLKHFIYLFHMGLFFFISGMFLSNPNLNNLKQFTQKKLNRLYIPFHCCPEKFYHSVSCLGPSPSGTLVVRSV